MRRSISWPIALGVTLIVLLVTLTVGWIVVNSLAAQGESAGLFYTLLAVGTTLFVVVLVGVSMYLWLSIKAVRLTQRQSNFIDSVTHELKSPIASLKLYLQTLEKRKLPEAQVTEIHQSMMEVLRGLDHLIDHLLDAARLEKKEIEMPLEDVDLAAILERCAASACRDYRLPPETVRLRLRPVEARGRAKEFEIIFRNLIDNALKYGGKEPAVEIETYAPRAQRVGIRISDNGPGIPSHLRRKIFGRFVRLGNELERQQAGTGLGLYIVRELVQRLGGRVQVLGRGNQPGTAFEVEFAGHFPQMATNP
ncbi:MAG: HAMP domain-containing sensor histidine kinase [Pirellulales bacterium]|nr:HAMP domain-containing sensor histidine kinase [Pirellulales bacterium]